MSSSSDEERESTHTYQTRYKLRKTKEVFDPSKHAVIPDLITDESRPSTSRGQTDPTSPQETVAPPLVDPRRKRRQPADAYPVYKLKAKKPRKKRDPNCYSQRIIADKCPKCQKPGRGFHDHIKHCFMCHDCKKFKMNWYQHRDTCPAKFGVVGDRARCPFCLEDFAIDNIDNHFVNKHPKQYMECTKINKFVPAGSSASSDSEEELEKVEVSINVILI